jgi:hypothetical protein
MSAPFLNGPSSPRDPFQGARLTAAAPVADPYADLLIRWRRAHAAVRAANVRAMTADRAYCEANPGNPFPKQANPAWWDGYEQDCRALIDDEDRLSKVEDGLFRAILAGPAMAAGIAAKIEVALAYLPDDFAAELGGEIIMAAKADAEHIAEKGGV